MQSETVDVWSPAQYKKFEGERAQPFWDLAALIDLAGVQRWLDVGCGSGELTRALHEKTRVPYTLGIDSSANMLAGAAAFSSPGLFFEQARVE
jgi:trans-aconitate 2-methyltransferase